MHCKHCGKTVQADTEICEFCGERILKPENRKPAVNTHLPLLAKICIAFSVIFLVPFISMIPAIEASKVDADIVTANDVHTAIYTALVDPEIVNIDSFNKDYESLLNKFDLTQCNTYDNCILSAAADTLGVEDFRELRKRIKSSGATGRILVTIRKPMEVQVVLEGTKMSQESGAEITSCNP